jgi:hypothetical protein
MVGVKDTRGTIGRPWLVPPMCHAITERRQLMSFANGDQMAKSIILWGVEESSMGVGSWNDEIICTLRKDRSLSLRPRKRGDDGTVSMAGAKRIRSPKIFVQALISMADSCFNYDINPKEIVDEICPTPDQWRGALDLNLTVRHIDETADESVDG